MNIRKRSDLREARRTFPAAPRHLSDGRLAAGGRVAFPT